MVQLTRNFAFFPILLSDFSRLHMKTIDICIKSILAFFSCLVIFKFSYSLIESGLVNPEFEGGDRRSNGILKK